MKISEGDDETGWNANVFMFLRNKGECGISLMSHCIWVIFLHTIIQFRSTMHRVSACFTKILNLSLLYDTYN